MPSNRVRVMLENAIVPKRSTPSFDVRSGPQMLAELIAGLGHDPTLISVDALQEIADRLSVIGRKEPAWGWRYLRNVLNRKIDASQKLLTAIMALGATIDGIPAELAGARQVSVMAVGTVTPGSLILASSRPCANPYCNLHFVPSSPRQRYHSAACRLSDYKRRKPKTERLSR